MTPEEKDARFEIFKATLREIDERNSQARFFNGTSVYGITCFADNDGPGRNYVMENDEHPSIRTIEDNAPPHLKTMSP